MMTEHSQKLQSCNNGGIHSSPEKQRPLKVLLVDDDPAVLEELKDVIELEDWEAITVPSADAALRELQLNPGIRVVVTDVHFGNGSEITNGIQFVSRARAKFANRALSFVVLSGDMDNFDSSRDEGAFKFLLKPPVLEQLIDTIRRAVTTDDGVSETREPFSVAGRCS